MRLPQNTRTPLPHETLVTAITHQILEAQTGCISPNNASQSRSYPVHWVKLQSFKSEMKWCDISILLRCRRVEVGRLGQYVRHLWYDSTGLEEMHKDRVE